MKCYLCRTDGAEASQEGLSFEIRCPACVRYLASAIFLARDVPKLAASGELPRLAEVVREANLAGLERPSLRDLMSVIWIFDKVAALPVRR